MAAIGSFNEAHRTQDWHAYLINDTTEAMETVLIVSSGSTTNQRTSTMRHKLELLPAKAYAKVEFLEDSVLKLNNVFKVTFFMNGKLFDKTFTFSANSIKEVKAKKLPVIPEKGILAE